MRNNIPAEEDKPAPRPPSTYISSIAKTHALALGHVRAYKPPERYNMDDISHVRAYQRHEYESQYVQDVGRLLAHIESLSRQLGLPPPLPK